jgi:hypothetical protein
MLKTLMQQANQKKDTIDGEDEGTTNSCFFKMHYSIHVDHANNNSCALRTIGAIDCRGAGREGAAIRRG